MDFSIVKKNHRVEKSGVEKFMVRNPGIGKFMVEKSGVEAWG